MVTSYAGIVGSTGITVGMYVVYVYTKGKAGWSRVSLFYGGSGGSGGRRLAAATFSRTIRLLCLQ